MGATKTGLSSLLACHRANHCGPDSFAAFPRLVYFTKVGTCWYLLQSGNPALVSHRQSIHMTSPCNRNCRALLHSVEPFKRRDFLAPSGSTLKTDKLLVCGHRFIWFLVQCTVIGMFVKYTCCGSLGLGSGLRSLFTQSLSSWFFCGVLCWGYVPCRHEWRGKCSWF